MGRPAPYSLAEALGFCCAQSSFERGPFCAALGRERDFFGHPSSKRSFLHQYGALRGPSFFSASPRALRSADRQMDFSALVRRVNSLSFLSTRAGSESKRFARIF